MSMTVVRCEDSSIDLVQTFWINNSHVLSFGEKAAEFLRSVEAFCPITDPQVAALALAQATIIGRYGV